MKHLLIVGGFFAVAASFSLQATAAEDLCSANIQSLKDLDVTTAETFPEVKKLVEETIKEAEADKAKGDTNDCIIITRKALLKLRTYNN
jgi:hypothetical protein